MATTTNYGWTTPDDTALVKDGAAAIRTLGSSVDTTTKALNPSTTLGDIEYRSSTANTNTRLGIGSTGNVLTVAGGVPTWAAPAPSGVTFSGCSVTASADQTIANGTYTTLTFNQETYDTDGFHSTSSNTGRFTVPAGKAGYYSIYAQVVFSKTVAINNGDLRIMKNGSVLQYSGEVGGTTSAIPMINFTLIANLAVADYLEIQVSQESGGNLTCFTSSSTGYAVYQFTYLGA